MRTGLILSLGTLILVGAKLADRNTEARLEAQQADLQSVRGEILRVERERNALARQLSGLSNAYGQLERALETKGERVGLTEAGLDELRGRIEEGQQRFTELFDASSVWRPEILEARLAEVDQRLEVQREELTCLLEQALDAARNGEAQAEAAQETARQTAVELAEATGKERQSPEELWRTLMGPVVQLNGATSVGSGVLLASVPRAGGGWRTYVLTAWHVVRDMQDNPLEPVNPIATRIYSEDGSVVEKQARVLCYRADLDACLCELDSDQPAEFGALLADRERILGAKTFEPIFAVGCPLGTDPIPTFGQIASPHHRVDGQTYWMINAPTYIGNSGGGIFDAESHQLLGLFSKIYNHGSSRPTIVPHMGLVTPLAPVLDWLETQGYQRSDEGLLIEVSKELAQQATGLQPAAGSH